MTEVYTYHQTNEIKHTRAQFVCWTPPDGHGERRALFKNPQSDLRIPERLLTQETKERIPPCPRDIPDWDGFNSRSDSYTVIMNNYTYFNISPPIMDAVYIDLYGLAEVDHNEFNHFLNSPWSEYMTELAVTRDHEVPVYDEVARFDFEKWEWVGKGETDE